MSLIPARTLFPGSAEGPVMALAEPLSFWGGLDPHSGLIVDRWHPDHGKRVTGTILIMAAGRGSSSSSTVFAEALRLSTAPAALVLSAPDSILLTGALVAQELYGKGCPIIVLDKENWRCCASSRALAIDAGEAQATLNARP